MHGMKLEKKRLVTNANGVSVRRYLSADVCAAWSMLMVEYRGRCP